MRALWTASWLLLVELLLRSLLVLQADQAMQCVDPVVSRDGKTAALRGRSAHLLEAPVRRLHPVVSLLGSASRQTSSTMTSVWLGFGMQDKEDSVIGDPAKIAWCAGFTSATRSTAW